VRNCALDLINLLGVQSFSGYILSNGVFRIAVPMFFIVNGYYLCDSIDMGAFQKWFVRCMTLFLFWSLIYIPFYFDFSSVPALIKSIQIFIMGYHHLWYLSAVVLAGIGIFLFRRRRKWLLIGIIVGLFIGVFLQYVRAYVEFSNPLLEKIVSHKWISRNFVTLAFPYMAMGYIIRRDKWIQAFRFRHLVVAFFLSLTAVIAESSFNFRSLQATKELGFDTLVSLVVLCPVSFMLVMKSSWKINSELMSKLASSLYFGHPLMIALAVSVPLVSGNNGYNLTLTTVFLSLCLFPIFLLVGRKFKFLR